MSKPKPSNPKIKLGLNLTPAAVAGLMGYVGEQKAEAASQGKPAVKIGDVASEALLLGIAQLRKKK